MAKSMSALFFIHLFIFWLLPLCLFFYSLFFIPFNLFNHSMHPCATLIFNLTNSTWYGVCLWSPWVPNQWSVWGGTKKLPWFCVQTFCMVGQRRHVSYRSSVFHGESFWEISWGYLPFDCKELQPFYWWRLQPSDWKTHSWLGESSCQIR